MLKSSVVLTGRLLIQKMNEKGEVIYKTEVPNIVVTAGKEFIASRLVSNDADVMNYMAIGDDPSSAVVTQTALQNELARNEVSGAIALNTTTTFTATFLAGTGTGDIKEAGIFILVQALFMYLTQMLQSIMVVISLLSSIMVSLLEIK